MSLVLDVGQEVLLERAGPLEAVLEIAALLDDLGELAACEEAAPLEVVELLVDHSRAYICHHP